MAPVSNTCSDVQFAYAFQGNSREEFPLRHRCGRQFSLPLTSLALSASVTTCQLSMYCSVGAPSRHENNMTIVALQGRWKDARKVGV